VQREEFDMLNALKKLIGADEESKARRKEALERERREREERVQQEKAKMQKVAESIRGDDEA
jgi:hypothetical protein